jgi:hypothetical protein
MRDLSYNVWSGSFRYALDAAAADWVTVFSFHLQQTRFAAYYSLNLSWIFLQPHYYPADRTRRANCPAHTAYKKLPEQRSVHSIISSKNFCAI